MAANLCLVVGQITRPTPYTKSFLCLYSNKSKKEIYLWKSQHYKHCVSKNIKVAFWLMIWSFWSWIFLQFVLFTKKFIYQYYQISYYYATVPLFHGNFWKKSKLFWKTAGVTQLFSKVHLKKCYCDARYLGKSVGDPLKIVQNESIQKRIPTGVHFVLCWCM